MRASIDARCFLWGLVLGGTLGGAGCSSTPSASQLLPNDGPTTLAVYEAHLGGLPPGTASTAPAPGRAAPPPGGWGVAAAAGLTAPSRRSHQALTDLQRDFQRVPNPDILGYVYPHLAGDLPVPGYYTVFSLYEKTLYAQPGEAAP
ncbi:MAG TPA: TIGR03751 family conjugal transfer lipoprotein [Candidatus Competibacter sp.]|nr:TIGR03751 family conjugal transfer lipoprotein [Candidatus Competibacter sp.]